MKTVAATAQALLARQMPGPWMWAGTPDDVALCTAHSGRHYLLGCERSGMEGAAFTFQFFDGDRPHIMHHAKKDGLLVPRAPHAPREIVGINHSPGRPMSEEDRAVHEAWVARIGGEA